MTIKSKYGVQKYKAIEGYVLIPGTQETPNTYYHIEWYDTLDGAVAEANGQPIIKSVAYNIEEQE